MTGVRGPLNAFLDTPQVPVLHAQSGILAGLRLAVKDIYDVKGLRTGCGNPQKFNEARPARESAAAVQTLLDSGARFIGKTQTDELAFSLMGQNVHYPYPTNPRAPGRVTGGSSSGSAAAVAGGLADIALGSDTGGSIRAPASFCGLIGLRTTHGRIDIDGVMPLAPSLDTVGWFASDIEVYEAVGKLLLGPDANKRPLRRAIGIPDIDALVLGTEEATEFSRIRSLVTLPLKDLDAYPFASSIEDLYWCFRQIQAREAWDIHGEWIMERPRNLGPGVDERFGFGRTVDPRKLRTEQVRRYTLRAELVELLGNDAVLVMPTVPGAAPLKSASPEALKDYREAALRLLCFSGLSGLPQITLPVGVVDDAPFGLSLLGPPDSDIALIRLGRRILANAGKA
jgi:amidase